MFGERAVEIPWLFKNLKEGSVLDIGSNESSYITRLVNEGRNITQLDIRPLNNVANTRKVVGDIRKKAIKDLGKFDNVLLISTLEHIGLKAYDSEADWKDSPALEQLRTFRHCMDFLKEGGRILLTVPYGKYENAGWVLTYDKDMIEEIKKRWKIINEIYFSLKNENYVECKQEECPLVGMDLVPNVGMRATSVVCLVLMK